MAKQNSNTQFEFISIQTPDQAKDPTTRRKARSHAVAQGLENKRKLQQKSGHNFRVLSVPSKNDPSCSTIVTLPGSTTPPGPFQMLAAESPGLQLLDSQYKGSVFSVSDELVLQNFRTVLRQGLNDHALLSAIMLTFAFNVTAQGIDKECLLYQNEALSAIQRRLGSPLKAASEPTLGAILLLAGIEARLGMPHQVQLHMGAIQQLLNLCRSKGVYLSDGIKRAIFWQDLNSSVMTGSSRVVDHTTFSELQWRRDTFSLNYCIIPSGFQAQSHLLSDGFLEVIKDVYALRCIREESSIDKNDVASMAHIDNLQASIQSRLVSLPNGNCVEDCCHLAAYLCSTMLRCKIWHASVTPSHLSLKLLRKLQQVNDDPVWDDCPQLLTWLLYLGGAFASMETRSGYMELLVSNRCINFRDSCPTWTEAVELLKQFIWSEKAFMLPVKAFWKEISM